MPKRSSKNPQDINEIAARVVGGLTEAGLDTTGKNPAAVALGRLGGLRGGKARASKLSPRKRKQIARKAARARWNRKTKK